MIKSLKYDYLRDRERTTREMIAYGIKLPYWLFLRKLARAGFIKAEPGAYLRLRDFTLFFWRTLVNRAIESERIHWEYKLRQARKEALNDALEYFSNRKYMED